MRELYHSNTNVCKGDRIQWYKEGWMRNIRELSNIFIWNHNLKIKIKKKKLQQ